MTGNKVVKKPMRKRNSYETVLTKKNTLFFRAIMIGRNKVIENIIDVILTKKDDDSNIYSQFEYDKKTYKPNVEEMIYHNNIRYGLFLIGVPDQLELPRDKENPSKLIAPVMDAETYCNRQNMSFFQNLLSATGKFKELLKMVRWELYLLIGILGAVALALLFIIDLWSKYNATG